jgi:hypothetical protein
LAIEVGRNLPTTGKGTAAVDAFWQVQNPKKNHLILGRRFGRGFFLIGRVQVEVNSAQRLFAVGLAENNCDLFIGEVLDSGKL